MQTLCVKQNRMILFDNVHWKRGLHCFTKDGIEALWSLIPGRVMLVWKAWSDALNCLCLVGTNNQKAHCGGSTRSRSPWGFCSSNLWKRLMLAQFRFTYIEAGQTSFRRFSPDQRLSDWSVWPAGAHLAPIDPLCPGQLQKINRAVVRAYLQVGLWARVCGRRGVVRVIVHKPSALDVHISSKYYSMRWWVLQQMCQRRGLTLTEMEKVLW